MNSKISIFLISIIAVFSFACSSAQKTGDGQKSEVVIEDGYKTTDNDELLIEDKDLKHIQTAVVTSRESSQQSNFVAADGSRISISLDGYGNKSETRYFDDDPRLQLVLLKTAPNGEKQVFVYGQNGEVRDLPPGMINQALTTPAAALAKAAGIYEGKKEQTVAQSFSGVTPQMTTATLQSMPTLQTLSNNQMTGETTQTVEAAKPQIDTLAKQTEPTDKTDKTDSTEQAKTPVRIAENLQNYLPKKRKDVITDNE
jgi:hypothetical protein